MDASRRTIDELIVKLHAYSSTNPHDYLTQSDIDLTTIQLQNHQNDPKTAELLLAFQHYGLDSLERANELRNALVACFEKSKNINLVLQAFYNLSSILYYTESIDLDTVAWLITEKRHFNVQSRAYKLEKSHFLACTLTLGSYTDLYPKIKTWIKQIIASNDDEYIDLLAFALNNNEVAADNEIQNCFGSYLLAHPRTEAKEEISLLLMHE